MPQKTKLWIYDKFLTFICVSWIILKDLIIGAFLTLAGILMFYCLLPEASDGGIMIAVVGGIALVAILSGVFTIGATILRLIVYLFRNSDFG
jgi:hypothetical protein